MAPIAAFSTCLLFSVPVLFRSVTAGNSLGRPALRGTANATASEYLKAPTFTPDAAQENFNATVLTLEAAAQKDIGAVPLASFDVRAAGCPAKGLARIKGHGVCNGEYPLYGRYYMKAYLLKSGNEEWGQGSNLEYEFWLSPTAGTRVSKVVDFKLGKKWHVPENKDYSRENSGKGRAMTGVQWSNICRSKASETYPRGYPLQQLVNLKIKDWDSGIGDIQIVNFMSLLPDADDCNPSSGEVMPFKNGKTYKRVVDLGSKLGKWRIYQCFTTGLHSVPCETGSW